jgi:hypothetical protein
MSAKEIAAQLHIPEPKRNKNLMELAAEFPDYGVGVRFYRKVRRVGFAGD